MKRIAQAEKQGKFTPADFQAEICQTSKLFMKQYANYVKKEVCTGKRRKQ